MVALGAALMLPPLVYVFNQPLTVFGIPQIVFYLFAVWLLLIIGTATLTYTISPDRNEADANEGER